jgi:Zn-dependent peptidase ImmA (M78 family)
LIRRKLCQAEAKRLLGDYAITKPAVDVEGIARSLFLDVDRLRPWPWRSRSLLDRAAGVIRINGDESPRGQRFCIGHEIGHFLLHPDADVFSEYVDPESLDYAPDPEKALEDEADYFSNALLVPPPWLRADVLAGLGIAALVCRYDVSNEVLFIALREHRLLSKLGQRS